MKRQRQRASKTMTQFIDPQPTPEVPSSLSEPLVVPAAPAKAALIAPLWHTLLITALILGNSFLGIVKDWCGEGIGSRILLYGGTFVTQLILILLIWFGIRLRGVRMRDLIGGRWKTVEAFLLDGLWLSGFGSRRYCFSSGFALPWALSISTTCRNRSTIPCAFLAPWPPTLILKPDSLSLLSVSAGLFEEIIFRGYLQRQLARSGRNAIIGIVASGILFGLAHGYQGTRMMIVIGIYGIFFGILAHLRKSLRPGMMAHAFQDSIAGIGLFKLVTRH